MDIKNEHSIQIMTEKNNVPKAMSSFIDDMKKRIVAYENEVNEMNEEIYKKGYAAGYKDGSAHNEYNNVVPPSND